MKVRKFESLFSLDIIKIGAFRVMNHFIYKIFDKDENGA